MESSRRAPRHAAPAIRRFGWRRGLAALAAVAMTLAGVSSATAQDAPTVGADSGVTVISDGKVVTDPEVIAATLNDDAIMDRIRQIEDADGDAAAQTGASSDNADTANGGGSNASADAQADANQTARAATDALGGRDFEGQATKEINGKTYILIGNEQQLRAIGSDRKVIGRIVGVKQTCVANGVLDYAWQDDTATRTDAYAGDADLAADATLRDQDASDTDKPLLACILPTVGQTRTKYYGVAEDGTLTDVKAANTGQTYKADANYIVFRDIDLNANAAAPGSTDWTPLMFSGTMLGAIAADAATAGSLWNAVDADGTGVAAGTGKPVISHVRVDQPAGNLEVDKQQGIGFFASITSKSSMTSSSGNAGGVQSLGTVTVANLKLSDVNVSNQATVAHVDQSLVSLLLGLVGTLLGPLGLGLDDLLAVHKSNPSNFATGAFAGRIYGDAKVVGCEVENAAVANVKDMTGGFAGYIEGATRYDIVSDALGTLIDVLTKVLNIIPFLGLGDLVDWLLNSTLGLNALIPVGYYNPVIADSHVNGLVAGTTLGNADSDYAGGFVGAQIGAIIEDSSVTSANAFTVRARKYAGGFVGVSRNGEVGGLLNSLGVTILSALRPQSLIENSSLTADGRVSVTAENYAGGFAGRLANAYAVNSTLAAPMDVTATTSHAGGFTGRASAGWGLEAGTDSDEQSADTSLVKHLTEILTKLLETNPDGAGALLTIAGVNPSIILGTNMSGDITVASGGDYAGGIVGDGSGTVIGDSSQARLEQLSFWKYSNPRGFPEQRSTTVSGLRSVSAQGSYAGGIAGNLQPTTIAGLLNSVIKIGDLAMLRKFDQFAAFTVENLALTGTGDGLTVTAGSYYAGGAIGCATGGGLTTVSIADLAKVEAKGEAGGFIGFSGPGDTVGANSLSLLGLIKVSGLLSVAEYSSVEVRDATVAGVTDGFTVAATGANTAGETNDYAAGGFYGQANSTKTIDAHVRALRSVTADTATSDGLAGGFVGYSTTGGLADAVNDSDDTTLLDTLVQGGLLSIDDLLGAVPYLIPNYKYVDVAFVNGGFVQADVAGGFAGDFQSGKVNQFTDKEIKDDPTLADLLAKAKAAPVAVVNIDHVTGGAYAGGFGGKVTAGALASAGKGGISLLGKLGTVNISSLLSLVSGYVPFILYAGVKSDAATFEAAGGTVDENADYGLTVSATRLDALDANSGSAGGFIGYGSGAQVSHSNVTQLRHTAVKAPADLETTGPIDDTYLGADSAYAVDAARYAGGYIGRMDIGSTAAVGQGLDLLGGTAAEVNVTEILSVLDVVVSTIEQSDVTGGIGGYAVRASAGGHTDADGTADPLGMAGGFAGDIEGGHIQNSNAHEFAYIIGQVAAGGYVGAMQPGAAANVLGKGNVFKYIVDATNAVSVIQDFVPTIRNSSTDAVICGGAVRAQAASDTTIRRGMAGGYVGHNRGGHIWGNDARDWSSISDTTPSARTAYAARIRSVYGAELAGGYTGFMEAADTADAGTISVLAGLVKLAGLANALSLVYPTEEHSAVTGPLRNMSYAQWVAWRDNVGKYGAYGAEFTDVVNAGAGAVTDQATLDAFIKDYIFGFDTVAGRAAYANGANLRDSGVAGGHVGLMRTGTITDGQTTDAKEVSAMRAAGGYAGAMEAGSVATFGSVELLGLVDLDLGTLLGAPQVFVPVIKASSVTGYRKGLRVSATGTDITHGTGNAGGYAGLMVGGQVWGDRDTNGDQVTADAAGAAKAAHADVSNLRKVAGRNNVGGYVGLAVSGSTADVDTNASDGFLQKVLDSLIGNANPAGLVNLLQATMVTIRGAHVSADSAEWGYTVEGAYTKDDGTAAHAVTAGGFAGSLQAAILGDRDSAKGSGTAADVAADPAELTVTGLRGVDGGQYAGGFFGLADVSSVASVGGGTSGTTDDTNLLLKLLKVGNVGVLEAFRTFIYDGRVAGVADGIQVKAHDANTYGMLDSTRFTGAAGGFGGGLINGSVKKSSVTNLNSVTGLNYTGGFIGHLGKSGTVDASKAEVTSSLLAGLTAGVMDIWGSHVDDSSVAGIPAGFTVTATHDGEDYGRGESLTNAKDRKGEEIAAGFAGYADLSRISGATVTNFKKASSGELAGGFAGQTTKAYLVDAGVNSALVNLLLKYVVNPLLDILYVNDIEHIGDKLDDLKERHFGWLTKFIDLELFTDGNALYVNLLGLKIGVALDKHGTENDDTDDTAFVFIGDSKIEVGCSKDGVDSDSVDNVKVQLIKANRTKISGSLVQGIADGYDVFGGGATQESDGTDGLKTGYAGGFVAVNDEGLLEGNAMTYADTIRGTSGLVSPFSGKTNLESVYDFNTVQGIEGNGNTYRIYRDVPASWTYALTSGKAQITPGSHMDDETGADGAAIDVTGALRLHLNRYDVAHLGNGADSAIKQFADYEDAVMANNVGGSDTGSSAGGVANEAAPLGVYASAAKAVLMLDTTVADNNGGLTPEPDDGQDPCGADGCQTVDLTLQKVWRNGHLERADAITLEVTATYTGSDGTQITPDTIACRDANCNVVDRANPFTVELTAKDNGSAWSDTWRAKVTGLPVAFVDKGSGANGEDVVRYYTYTVRETQVTFDDGSAAGSTKTPAEAGYTVDVAYGKYVDGGDGKYVATVTNSSPLPNTGGTGTMMFVILGVLLMALGAAWYLRNNRSRFSVATGGQPHVTNSKRKGQ